MTVTDLHTALEAAINKRLEVVRAAAEHGPYWLIGDVPPFTNPLLLASTDDGEAYTTLGTVDRLDVEVQNHIALHDPADAIRRYERDLGLIDLYRHFNAESEGQMTAAEIHEHYGQLELLRDLLADLLNVYPEARHD